MKNNHLTIFELNNKLYQLIIDTYMNKKDKLLKLCLNEQDFKKHILQYVNDEIHDVFGNRIDEIYVSKYIENNPTLYEYLKKDFLTK